MRRAFYMWMRAAFVAAVFLLSSLAAHAAAQLAASNNSGVAMGHLHYRVPDVDAARRFWTTLGGEPLRVGDADVIKFPDVLVFLERGESTTGGTEGSVVNHVAFRVPSLAAVEAAGLEVARLSGFPGVASVRTPEGERIELFENAALNLTFTPDDGFKDPAAERHNRPLTLPIAFHHIHLYVPPGSVQAAKAWYVRLFGGIPGKRSQYEAVDLPGVNLNISEAPKPTVALRGRVLDHLGFEVSGLEAFCRTLAGMGIAFHVPYNKGASGIGSAMISDPWGTFIELTEGLRQ